MAVLVLVLALLVTVTAGVAVAVRLRATITRLRAELEELAARDGLTGALTRVAFERAFAAWVGDGLRRNAESSLLLLNIDRFDEINGEHGHEAGNQVLAQVVKIVKDVIRETDAVGRVAGGQFGVLLPATGGDQALGTAERIRFAVARRSEECGVRFTTSIGVTGGHSFRDAWGAAERALTLAQSAGHDRVVLAETETQAEPQTDPGGQRLTQVS